MKLTITIELDNAAFHDDDGPNVGPEVARLLHKLAGRLEDARFPHHLDAFRLRSDGNTVGSTSVSE